MIGQYTGKVDWKCPNCGRWNTHHVSPLRFEIRCNDKDCQWHCVVGVLVHGVVSGPKRPPSDQLCAQSGIFRSGETANGYLCISCASDIRADDAPTVQVVPKRSRQLKRS